MCPQWPSNMLDKIPYANKNVPDYIELLTYSELDSLFMSYGHLRAANPASQIEYSRSGLLPTRITHLTWCPWAALTGRW